MAEKKKGGSGSEKPPGGEGQPKASMPSSGSKDPSKSAGQGSAPSGSPKQGQPGGGGAPSGKPAGGPNGGSGGRPAGAGGSGPKGSGPSSGAPGGKPMSGSKPMPGGKSGKGSGPGQGSAPSGAPKQGQQGQSGGGGKPAGNPGGGSGDGKPAGAGGTGPKGSGPSSGAPGGKPGAVGKMPSPGGGTPGSKPMPGGKSGKPTGAGGTDPKGSGPGQGSGQRGTKSLPKNGEKTSSAASGAESAGKAGKAADTASKAGKAADTADKTDKAAKTAKNAETAAKGIDKAKDASKGMDGVEGRVARQATERAVGGGEDAPKARKNVGRYAGAAASGAAFGAKTGAAAGGVGAIPGAAVGAAKGVAVEAGTDVTKGAVKAGAKAAEKAKEHAPAAESADKLKEKGKEGESAKKLGAGGTSYQREKKDEDKDKKKKSLGKKAAGAAAVGGAAAAAPPATAMLFFMMLLQWLKAMFFATMAALANAAGWLLAMLKAIGSAIIGIIKAPFTLVGKAVGGFVSFFTGIGTAITAPLASGVAGGAAVAGIFALLLGFLFGGGIGSSTIAAGGDSNSSSGRCIFPGGGGTVPAGDMELSEQEEANAIAIWSVLSEWGMPDENIAGILGNFSAESGAMDPTSVETIHDEPYQIGPRKQEAWDNDFVASTFMPADYLADNPGVQIGGIGLAQWSNDRNPRMLEWTAGHGLDWYSIPAQLAFMTQGDNPGDVQTFKRLFEEDFGGPAGAADFFHDEWERSNDTAGMAQRRADYAEDWYGLMSGWEIDGEAVGEVENIEPINISDVVATIFGACEPENAALASGGLDEEAGHALAEEYNETADEVLNAAFNGGGPAKCEGSYVRNCVSFTWWFLLQYTDYDGGYVSGNGKNVAGNLAASMGRQTSSTPSAYSVFSHNDSPSTAGHTGIVLAVDDNDRLLVGEAGYCAYDGRVRWVEPSEWKGKGWEFLDVSDMMGDSGLPMDSDVIPAGNTPGSAEPGDSAPVDLAREYTNGEYNYQLGAPSSLHGPGPGNTFDCSSFTRYIYYQTLGVDLPRNSEMQRYSSLTTEVPRSEAKPGDLIWWPGHVGIYSGGDSMVHAVNPSMGVAETRIFEMDQARFYRVG